MYKKIMASVGWEFNGRQGINCKQIAVLKRIWKWV